jgi:hypothetical protein
MRVIWKKKNFNLWIRFHSIQVFFELASISKKNFAL